jgi:hypothetical protein
MKSWQQSIFLLRIYLESLSRRWIVTYIVLFALVGIGVASTSLAAYQSCDGDPPPCDLREGTQSGPCSPIIIDTENEGFHLTSSSTGVSFDISGTEHPVQLAWTDPQFHNSFLALPGTDGLVHNGKQLFGNFTPQPQSPNPNGFLALAQFDLPENGGNGDGIIDPQDRIFSALRLWVDTNHDGVSQPEELFKLPDRGVFSISLHYKESRRIDKFGNQFRYRGQINISGSHNERSGVDPVIYDVFLTEEIPRQ